MSATQLNARIDTVRAFNRRYTRRIGLLGEGYLESPFSLTEVRVLYELAQRDASTAKQLADELDLDAGYLSRLLRRFHQQGLIAKTTSPLDRRSQMLTLTGAGRVAFAPLVERSRDDIGRIMSALPPEAQERLVDAMRTIQNLLDPDVAARPPVLLRAHRPGDLGWIVRRHAELYVDDYGWDAKFEGLVARIVADFAERFDPAREQCWIAERDGVNIGSIMLVAHPERAGVAKLRLLIVVLARGDSALDAVWSKNVSASHAAPGIGLSHSGPTACSIPPAGSTKKPDSSWWRRLRTPVSAKTSPSRPGSWISVRNEHSPRGRPPKAWIETHRPEPPIVTLSYGGSLRRSEPERASLFRSPLGMRNEHAAAGDASFVIMTHCCRRESQRPSTSVKSQSAEAYRSTFHPPLERIPVFERRAAYHSNWVTACGS